MKSEMVFSFEKFVEERYKAKKRKAMNKEAKEYHCLSQKEKDDYRRNVIEQLALRINFLFDRELIDREGYFAVPMNLNIDENNWFNSKYPKSIYEAETMKEELAHLRELNRKLDGNMFLAEEEKWKRELYEWLNSRYVCKYDRYVQRNFIDCPVGKHKLFMEISKEEYELFYLLLVALSTGFMKRKNKKWEDVNIEHRIRILELLSCVDSLPNLKHIEYSIEDVKRRLLLPECCRIEELVLFVSNMLMTENGYKRYCEDESIRNLLVNAEKKLMKIYHMLDEKETEENDEAFLIELVSKAIKE